MGKQKAQMERGSKVRGSAILMVGLQARLEFTL